MPSEHTKLRELERRFAHMNRTELGESVIYKTRSGRELFRLEGQGTRLRVPVSLEVLQSLFGNLPFAVEPFGDSCVIPLGQIRDEVLLWTLLEAIGEQTVDTPDEIRKQNPIDVIEQQMNLVREGRTTPLKRGTGVTEKSEIAGAMRHLPVQFIVRVVAVGVVLMLAAFLALSYILGSNDMKSDRQIQVEELLR